MSKSSPWLPSAKEKRTSYSSVNTTMYVRKGTHTARVWINRVRLQILLVISRTGKMEFSCPRSPLRIWSRETGAAVPSRARHLAHLHTQAKLGAYLRDSSRVLRQRPLSYSNRYTPSGHSRAYQATLLRTDGVHCREAACTGPLNLKVVPNGCCLGRSPWTK